MMHHGSPNLITLYENIPICFKLDLKEYLSPINISIHYHEPAEHLTLIHCSGEAEEHNHATMMVILETATITSRAVMHPRYLVARAFVTKFELTVVLHFVVYYRVWRKIVIEK